MQEVDLAIVADMGTLQRLPSIVGHGELPPPGALPLCVSVCVPRFLQAAHPLWSPPLCGGPQHPGHASTSSGAPARGDEMRVGRFERNDETCLSKTLTDGLKGKHEICLTGK